jgi:hypothetical protein
MKSEDNENNDIMHCRYTVASYHGIISRNHITESYHGIISRHHATALYHGIIWRPPNTLNDVMLYQIVIKLLG